MFLICISLMIRDIEHLFMYLLAICVFSLENSCIQVFVYFLIKLFVLDTDPFMGMCFANVSSQSVACLSVLLTEAFTEQKFLILINSTLSIFLFVLFSVVFENAYQNPRPHRFYLCFLVGFILSHFICRSMIYFEVIFEKAVNSVSRFIYLFFTC